MLCASKMKTFMLTLGALALSAIGAFALTQCSSSSNGDDSSDANESDSGTDSSGSSCPTNPPFAGDVCSVGVECDYSSEQNGCTYAYVCINRKWIQTAPADGGEVESGALECPTTVPEAGSSCVTPNPCSGAENECPFLCPNGQQAFIGTCTNDQWAIITVNVCSADFDAGPDASAIDAGDAG